MGSMAQCMLVLNFGFLFILGVLSVVYAGVVCPAGKSSVGGICYKLDRMNHATWGDARNLCKRNGGLDLLVVPNDAVFWDVVGLLNGDGDTIWIGASDNSQLWNFRWVDESSCCGSWWLPSQPDNKGKERCVYFWNNHGRKGLNNADCNHRSACLCQYKGNIGCVANSLEPDQTQSYRIRVKFVINASGGPSGDNQVGGKCMKGAVILGEARFSAMHAIKRFTDC